MLFFKRYRVDYVHKNAEGSMQRFSERLSKSRLEALQAQPNVRILSIDGKKPPTRKNAQS